MFLKSLIVKNNDSIIREIFFHKGLNLIIDETNTHDKRESGNNIGKTTGLRLIDYCLGSDGRNIYQDPEFKSKTNTSIKDFLKKNNIVVVLTLKEDIDNKSSKEIIIRRNFLSHKNRMLEINGHSYLGNTSALFCTELKKLIFNSENIKPSFRQIISKNIRDEKNKLVNTLKILHPTTTSESYEALYMFWLGIDVEAFGEKQKLAIVKQREKNFQSKLLELNDLPQIKQNLIVLEKEISVLEEKRNGFISADAYKKNQDSLNKIRAKKNSITTEISSLDFRRELIDQSRVDLEKDYTNIEAEKIKELYQEAKKLYPELQRTFEETLKFHNNMVEAKISFITSELPELNKKINKLNEELGKLLLEEKMLFRLVKSATSDNEVEQITTKLKNVFYQKGELETQKTQWENSESSLESIERKLKEINEVILDKDYLIEKRVTDFNRYFSQLSDKLYGEKFVLSYNRNDKQCYYLHIANISGNLGAGKKKAQIAAFDLSYIQFAEENNIKCLHFILHDQIETIHGNQAHNLLKEIVNDINCQYIVPVLRDKLPKEIDVNKYGVLSLSESDKFFKL